MRALAMIAALAFGCAGGGDAGDISDGGFGDSAVGGCTIEFDPIDPVASSTLPIRAYLTNLGAQGVLSFGWSVTFGGSAVSYTQEASDGSQIGFIAASPGIYTVSVSVSGAFDCNFDQKELNVRAPGANAGVFRLRTVPAPDLAPPQETLVEVFGGADVSQAIPLSRGSLVTGVVRNSATNATVPAYLKFMPTAMPTAFSEMFTAGDGAYSLRLLTTNHQVLVIPTTTTPPLLAPKLVPWTPVPSTPELLVGPGTAVTGFVRGPNGAGFAGAKVQLYAGGVPSTLATTAPDGSFSVRTDFPANATSVTIKVTPPAASGLPRLEATSGFDLGASVQIQYSATLQTCALSNVPVRRGGVAQASADVTVVGTLAGVAGTIAGVDATNTVRVAATADGAGRMSALVPRGSLVAVSALSATDHAASALDTSTCNVTQIDAPAQTTVSGTTRKDAATPLAGVRIEAEPIGVLALAGIPPVQVTSNGSGAFSLPLAGGGRYNVRFADPQARAAPLVANDVAPLGVPTSAVLPKALAISGEVSVVNSANPVVGASIQILCASCGGSIDIARPIAETATDTISRYRIAVPDPGTM
jgi:hypothetical protein